MKRLIPSKIRLRLKLTYRKIVDIRSSDVFAKNTDTTTYPFVIQEQQPIKQTGFYENKIDNIALGAGCIENVIIKKDEVLSFWSLIGEPTYKRGYKEGRNLICGQLRSDVGGGLCQLSGIMYLTALKAGLKVTERHNHTLDIYKEEERFAPLGSDATVVYGYKDLRIRNPYSFPVKFKFEIVDSFLICKLYSLQEIQSHELIFLRKDSQYTIYIETLRNGTKINDSVYQKI